MGGAVISLFLLTNLRKNVWGRTLQIIIGVVTIVVIAAIVYINFNWSWRYSRTENNSEYGITYNNYITKLIDSSVPGSEL